jgi:hypothetical protein
MLDLLLSDPASADRLAPWRRALVRGPRPESTLVWVKRNTEIIAALGGGELPIDHAALDALPRSPAVEWLRAQLVETGCLPRRERLPADLESWLQRYLSTVEPHADRLVIHEYATWRVLASMRRRAGDPPSAYHVLKQAKSQVQAAAEYLTWLRRGETALCDASQPDLDEYLSLTRRTARLRPFLVWAAKKRKTPRLVIRSVPPGPRLVPGEALERWDLLARLLHDGELEVALRVVGCVILLYAQPLTRVLALKVDDVAVNEDESDVAATDVSIRFGVEFVRLPSPLAGLVLELLADRQAPRSSLDVDPGSWLFPGRKPGHPRSHTWMTKRLKALGLKPGRVRARAMLHLAQRLDAPLLARMLGISFSTATQWQELAGQEFGGYVGRVASLKAMS